MKRTKNARCIRKQGIVITAAVLSLAASVFGQGSLTPPGAPGATMKTLDQVEARTPISRPGTTISESGSYYLTGNLNATGSQQGVRISADDVTIDLNGFTIDGSAVTTSGNGVYVNPGVNNALVFNGTIKNSFANGIYAANTTNCVFRNLVIVDNSRTSSTYDGITGGIRTVVENCRCEGNGDAGISARDGSRIVNNTVVRNGRTGLDIRGAGSFIDGNMVKENVTNYLFDDGNQLNLLLCEIPETLEWPCSAKLAGSLSSTTHGVVIAASEVTLDLMGFEISGDLTFSDYGVYLVGATNNLIKNVVVRNGTVRNFGYGIWGSYVQNSRFENLLVVDNDRDGCLFSGDSAQCNGNTLAHCTINGNGYSGIRWYGIHGQCNGNTMVECTVSENGSVGISFNGGDGQCDGNVVSDCTINGNGTRGIYSECTGGQAKGNTFTDCSINGNGDAGIYLSGSKSSIISGCVLSDNAGSGVYLSGQVGGCNGNTIVDCTISENSIYGIYLYEGFSTDCDGNSITGCTIRENTSIGIYIYSADGNRVEGNHISGQTGTTSYGIYSSGSDNLIFRNTCVGQTSNFQINSGNVYGPIVTASGALPTTGDGSHPLANFSF